MARKATDVKLTWIAINPETLPAEGKKRYMALKKCFAATKDAKESFETWCNGVILETDFPDTVVVVPSLDGKSPATERLQAHPLAPIKAGMVAGMDAKYSYIRGIAVAVAVKVAAGASRMAASLAA